MILYTDYADCADSTEKPLKNPRQTVFVRPVRVQKILISDLTQFLSSHVSLNDSEGSLR